ncbi:MAG: cystathionine beta-synthase [Flammeovirgaceae bacterium]|nr:cystathionine beta-synthase [Flammeovirgaceae bacterium]|tara:strand:+ start:3094 stop:4467 length:1374 start_codon:yes stop_codon:yes gene_type:complete
MKYYNNIVDTIGNTPLVKLNHLSKGIKGTILVKVEYFNPGNSIKDRIAIKMIENAEQEGLLRPGGTIIEGTSGNTGMGLALVAQSKGYKCIFTLADKQSQEKIDVLRAVGAEVIVCPTNVEPSDPRSYYSIAKKLNKEIPNSFYPNQYDNPGNWMAHYQTTAPEIWLDTKGKVTVYAAGMGTGGTISGTSKYLKEQNPSIITLGIDSYGSVFKKFKETGTFDESEVYPYLTEGIGEDILPENVDFSSVDHIVKVTDKDAAIMTRRLAREEGLFVGWSCGSAVFGAIEWAKSNLKKSDVMVIILPDHGTRYLGKIYNDNWMKDHGFIESGKFASAKDIINNREYPAVLSTIEKNITIGEAIVLMNEKGIDQIPVTENGSFVGSLSDSKVLKQLIENPEIKSKAVAEVMDPSFQFVSMNNTLDVLSSLITKENKALLIRDELQKVHIITQSDLLMAMSH